jgi:lipoyl(octanoyl) transferase
MTIPARLLIDERVSYEKSLDVQARMASKRAGNVRPDSLWLLEHDPVFTAGRTIGSSAWPLSEGSKEISGIPVVQTGRGGSLTYHGPGQVIGYPILRLKDYCPGPKLYVRMLEEVILRVLDRWNISAHRLDRLPGVWMGTEQMEKIASIGVRISHGITTHGFALNVDLDLSPFSHIVPCGIPGCRMTSMSRILGHPVDVAAVKSALAAAFADVFRMTWITQPGVSGQPPGKLTMAATVQGIGQ